MDGQAKDGDTDVDDFVHIRYARARRWVAVAVSDQEITPAAADLARRATR